MWLPKENNDSDDGRPQLSVTAAAAAAVVVVTGICITTGTVLKASHVFTTVANTGDVLGRLAQRLSMG